jgi:septal ring factor EnvC (AmiA/AmiB activator)
MTKYQGPHIPSPAAQQAERIEQLTAQVKRLASSLVDAEHKAQVAEGQRDMLTARNDELNHLLHDARNELAYQRRLLDIVLGKSVINLDVRAEIEKELGIDSA